MYIIFYLYNRLFTSECSVSAFTASTYNSAALLISSISSVHIES